MKRAVSKKIEAYLLCGVVLKRGIKVRKMLLRRQRMVRARLQGSIHRAGALNMPSTVAVCSEPALFAVTTHTYDFYSPTYHGFPRFRPVRLRV